MSGPKKDSDGDYDRSPKGEREMPSQSDRGSNPYDYEGKQSYKDSGGEFDTNKHQSG